MQNKLDLRTISVFVNYNTVSQGFNYKGLYACTLPRTPLQVFGVNNLHSRVVQNIES